MKLTEEKLKSMIRESIFKRLFGKKEASKEAEADIPDEIAADFGGGSEIQVGDDFDLDSEEGVLDKKISRRDAIKGGIGLGLGAAAAATLGSYATDIMQSNPEMAAFFEKTFDLTVNGDMVLFREGVKALNERVEKDPELSLFADLDKVAEEALSGIDQITPRKYIEIVMPVLARHLYEHYQKISGSLSQLEKLTLEHLNYEYLERAPNYVGIVLSEDFFGLIYGYGAGGFVPLAAARRFGGPQRFISIMSDWETNDAGFDLYENMLRSGYLDTEFVRVNLKSPAFKDRILNGVGSDITELITSPNITNAQLSQGERYQLYRQMGQEERIKHNQESIGLYREIFGTWQSDFGSTYTKEPQLFGGDYYGVTDGLDVLTGEGFK